MKNFDIDRFNAAKIKLGENPVQLVRTDYEELIIVDDYLVDANGKRIGTKGDMYHKKTFDKILQEGCLDHDPRPYYIEEYENAKYYEKDKLIITEDERKIEIVPNEKLEIVGNKVIVKVPAHTLSANEGIECTYDLSIGESPMITLRPIASRSSVAEILWIYQMQSNDLVDFDELLKKNTWDKDHKINNWWEEWALRDKNGKYILNEKGHPIIGACYGGTTGLRNMIYQEVIEAIRKNPDGRRNITCLWQTDDFKSPHGLKPCAFLTIWNVRHGWDGKDYLDMTMVQRSSDFATAGCINQVQYAALQIMVAKDLGYTPGYFTWKPVNVQIYDRHINESIEMLNRTPVNCKATIKATDKNNFRDFTPDDIYFEDLPKELIKEKNPQLKFQLGI